MWIHIKIWCSGLVGPHLEWICVGHWLFCPFLTYFLNHFQYGTKIIVKVKILQDIPQKSKYKDKCTENHSGCSIFVYSNQPSNDFAIITSNLSIFMMDYFDCSLWIWTCTTRWQPYTSNKWIKQHSKQAALCHQTMFKGDHKDT